jgi:hypothetical protein
MSERNDLAMIIEEAIFGTAREDHAIRSGLRGAEAVLAAGYRVVPPDCPHCGASFVIPVGYIHEC